MGGASSSDRDHAPSKPPAALNVGDVFENGKEKVNPTFDVDDEGDSEVEVERKESFNGFNENGADTVAAGEVQYAVMDAEADAVARGEVTYTAVGFGEGGSDDEANKDEAAIVYSTIVPSGQNRADNDEEVQYTTIGFGEDVTSGRMEYVSGISASDVGKRCKIDGFVRYLLSLSAHFFAVNIL